LEWLRLRLYLLLAEGIASVLLGEALAICILLAVPSGLRLLRETSLLRIESLLWLLLLLEARLLIGHSSGLGHWLLVLFNGVKEVNQIRRGLLRRFSLLGRVWHGLRLVAGRGLCEGGFGTRGRRTPILLDPFTSQIFSPAKVEVRIIQVIFKEARQVGGSMLELRDLQPGGGLEVPSNSQELHHFLRLFCECLVDCQGTFTIRSRHFKVMLCSWILLTNDVALGARSR
jgi:hypothetical protein